MAFLNQEHVLYLTLRGTLKCVSLTKQNQHMKTKCLPTEKHTKCHRANQTRKLQADYKQERGQLTISVYYAPSVCDKVPGHVLFRITAEYTMFLLSFNLKKHNWERPQEQMQAIADFSISALRKTISWQKGPMCACTCSCVTKILLKNLLKGKRTREWRGMLGEAAPEGGNVTLAESSTRFCE